MRISDWSSDVCSSDLNAVHASVFVNLHGLHFGFRRQNRRYFEMAYLPSGGLSELVQLRPGFLHILRTRALTECALIVDRQRSEEHTSALQSLMRISYAVFC